MAGSELGDIAWYLDSNSGITHFRRIGNFFLKISVFTKLFEHFKIEIELGVKAIEMEPNILLIKYVQTHATLFVLYQAFFTESFKN